MNKKYTVFICSSYKDLKPDRRSIINAIFELGDLPICMERFYASTGDTLAYIKQYIDLCDYFILIVGNHIGSICSSTGLSYTELELRYAIDRGLRPLVFIKESNTRDNDTIEFIKRIHNNTLCIGKYWTNRESLVRAVMASYIEERIKKPGLGWVRGGFPGLRIWGNQKEARDHMLQDYRTTNTAKILAIRGNSFADRNQDLNFVFSRKEVDIEFCLSDGENDDLLVKRGKANLEDKAMYKKELEIAHYKIKQYSNSNNVNLFLHEIDLSFRLLFFDNALYISFFGSAPAQKSEVYRFEKDTKMYSAFFQYYTDVKKHSMQA